MTNYIQSGALIFSIVSLSSAKWRKHISGRTKRGEACLFTLWYNGRLSSFKKGGALLKINDGWDGMGEKQGDRRRGGGEIGFYVPKIDLFFLVSRPPSYKLPLLMLKGYFTAVTR